MKGVVVGGVLIWAVGVAYILRVESRVEPMTGRASLLKTAIHVTLALYIPPIICCYRVELGLW